MSYNEEIASNNADLQSILDSINALPEAGGNVKENVSLTLSLTSSGSSYWPTVFYSHYDGEELKSHFYAVGSNSTSTTLTVAKGHLVFITCKSTTSKNYGVTSYTAGNGVTAIESSMGNTQGAYKYPIFMVNDNATLSVTIGSSSGSSTGGGNIA